MRVARIRLAGSNHRYSLKRPTVFTEPADLKVSSQVAHLLPSRSQGGSSVALQRSILAKDGNGTAYSSLQSANAGASFAVDIDFGNQTFSVLFDTGSSDLWIPHQTVKCVDYFNRPQLASECGFGPLYHGDFEEGNVEDTNFNITYGDGEFLTGYFGYQDVTLAGIKVKKQQSALVDYAYWLGDNETSGLLGFAYPALTSAFPGDNPKKDNANMTDEYPNWISNAIDGKLLDQPLFSVAIERGENGGGGYVALGGYPPIDFKKEFTSTPIQILRLSSRAPQKFAKEYTFYTIIPDGFVVRSKGAEHFFDFAELTADHKDKRANGPPGYGPPDSASSSTSSSAPASTAPLSPPLYSNSSDSDIEDDPAFLDTDFPVIVDTGTTLNYLPSKVVEKIASLFSPPAIYVDVAGMYEALCDAEPPEIGVVINGTEFQISPLDSLITGDAGLDPFTGLCVLGFQESYRGPWILGDVFLKNVVAVFDVGAGEMRFAPHINYTR
ncbi:acid protease [Polychaeton citri CBS 116435]|uniref:Acid protease n=1 Tax=Polychaeton citri CBS 116435 TaxID=1314669 RepID=A0A9P4Q1H3_9PEZI|nr:acid protease [Polychaeton citri CBS 116435]